MSTETPKRIVDDMRPNAGSIRAREALTKLEKGLQIAMDTIIAGQFWSQVEALERLADQVTNDLKDPTYRPTESIF